MFAKVVGNISLAVALLLYLVPLAFLSGAPVSQIDATQGQMWSLILVLLPLWFCLASALCSSVVAGGLDWLTIGRGAQIAGVLITSVAMAVVTILSGILRHEKADQIPWAVRPLTPSAWAMWLFPPVVMLYCLLTINPGIGSSVPRLLYQAPMAVVGGLCLLVSAGMLLQWFVDSQQAQQRRAEAVVSDEERRMLQEVEEVRALDGETQLYQLLRYTNRYKDPKVRDPAIAKIRANSHLEQLLIEGLRGPWCEEVLTFLDASDPPDNKALAEPARDSFLFLADKARERVKEPGVLYPETFDYQARLMLSVADKFRGLGVDYAPSIRAFRGALDEPRREKVRFNCAATIDDWLARDAKRAK